MKTKVLGILILVGCTVWLAALSFPDSNLRLVACDVGQGDAILATQKSTQVLFDGGPNSSVINCLSRYMPFWDRTIEVVVLSHPQADHMTGLIEVFERYKVNTFIITELVSSTPEYRALEEQVGGSGTRIVKGYEGTEVGSGLIHLDILFPTREFFSSNTEALTPNSVVPVLGTMTTSRDPNDFSVLVLLTFKDFKALFTGDSSPEILEKLTQINGAPNVNYIKVPHHGSKNGLVESFLDIVKPEVAVISAGKKNSFGHPHKEVLEMLSKRKIKILRTDDGEDVVETDGERVWVK